MDEGIHLSVIAEVLYRAVAKTHERQPHAAELHG